METIQVELDAELLCALKHAARHSKLSQ